MTDPQPLRPTSLPGFSSTLPENPGKEVALRNRPTNCVQTRVLSFYQNKLRATKTINFHNCSTEEAHFYNRKWCL